MNSPTTQTGRHTNLPTWILAIILLVALISAVLANVNHTNHNANKVIGTIDIDNGDQKINWNRYVTTEIELADSLTIGKSGIYHLTGSLKDAAVIVDAGVDGVVKLILDNISIENSQGPAIACMNGEDLVIELIGENYLVDGSSYSADFDEDTTGALYSKADLTFTGTGSLDIVANYQDGIVGKDDVKFISGSYNINAKDDGVRGKDSVYIMDGDFTINSAADAIKSTNEIDANKGFVLIEKGTFNLVSMAKGIKAINSILINGGDFIIDSYDDSIHSNNYIGIKDGNFSIKASDDGVHADKEFIMDGGTITISKSYEGVEAQAIKINGGKIDILASDDGMNAGGGADSSATNRKGAGAFDVDTSCVITINGGEIYVNASGDGIDSNGYLYINGGDVVVDGPINNGNGALDAGAGIVMNGGMVIALGASGMAESLGVNSLVNNISVYLSSTMPSGTKIEITDSSNNSIIRHTAAKNFSHIAAGTEKFILGESYTIYLDGKKYQTFTITNITTTIGNQANNQNTNNGTRPGMMK